MHIRISLPAQTLELTNARGDLLKCYSVSTAERGAGEMNGSFMTPRGRHIIRAKIGAGLPARSVFARRRPTGEVWTPAMTEAQPHRDWILSRILWLSGREPGFNRLGTVDTMRRYIYVHGCADSAPMGVPLSHGCIRMRNDDVIDLFERVPLGTEVDILETRTRAGEWDELEQAIRQVRVGVFVRELGMPPPAETDAWDAVATHVVAFGPNDQAVGVARLLPQGYIGHCGVLDTWRNKGVGRALMEQVLVQAQRKGMTSLMLHAKAYCADFYAKFGFVQEGLPFLEIGLPHVMMVRQA